MLTQQRLLELLDCDQSTGLFRWKDGRVDRGSFGGYRQSDGYLQIKIDGKFYVSHRLVWLVAHGEFPKNQIDHINRDKKDNRISNLRDVKPFENMQNVGMKKHNSSGFKGVSWEKSVKKWRSQLCVNGRRIHIGYYDNPIDAGGAYMDKRTELQLL